ncbi:MAG: hypothetical protein U0401_10555 [Anaerolineae bacterium]
MAKTLTLVETAAQVQWLVKQADYEQLLAITPEAAYTCQQLAQPYLKLEDYAHVTKRLSEYAPVLQSYLEWEAWLDQWGQQAIPEFGANGFRAASAATYLLQFFFAEIWATSVNIRELLEAINPTQVALWPPHITSVPSNLQPRVSPLAILAPPIVRQYGIDFVDLSEQAPGLRPITPTVELPLDRKSFISGIKAWLRQKPLITDIVQTGLDGLWPYLKPLRSGAPRILFSGYTYDLSSLARALRKQGAHITCLSDKLSGQAPGLSSLAYNILDDTVLTEAGGRLLQTSELWKPLEQWGVERTPLWDKPLHFWWHQLVPQFWSHYQQVRQLLSQHKFTALVTWDSGGDTLSGGATNAAERAGVPRYIYQHGGSSGLDAKRLQMYLRFSDTFLVHGQQTVDELRQSCPPFLQPCAQVISVGSGQLDLLRQQNKPENIRRLRAHLQAGDNRPLIMYIPTCFGTYGRAISDLAAHPDVSYFELQQTVLKLWQEMPEVRLLYKEFIIVPNDPNNTVMRDFVQTQIPGAIVTNQRLTDLMWAVDAIVVDHVITAISEILLTKKPVVVYMPQPNTSSPQAKSLLQKRATVTETPLDFIAEVRNLLQKRQYPELENPNTEFSQAYSTHSNDGCSAERAASFILQGKRPG